MTQWIFYVWCYGFLSSLLGTIIAPDQMRQLQSDAKIPNFLSGQILVVMAAIWPILWTLALIGWIRKLRAEAKLLTPEEQVKIEKEAGIARENYLAEKMLRKAKADGARMVQLSPVTKASVDSIDSEIFVEKSSNRIHHQNESEIGKNNSEEQYAKTTEKQAGIKADP